MPQQPPDLTGVNAAYRVTHDLYTIFTTDQKIVFDDPVFLTSMIISVGGQPLALGADWFVVEDDVTTMSKMKILDVTFNARLIKTIQISSNVYTRPYQIACTYQCLYKTPSRIFAEAPVAPRLLPRDKDEQSGANIVNNEIYAVNTFNGQHLIVPASGSFFADSLTVALRTNPLTPLVAGTDYILVNCDLAKTRESSNLFGVYWGILLTRPYAGDVSITYHAYGGDATLADLIAIWEALLNLLAYLHANTFLTPALLGSTSIITSIIARLVALEAGGGGSGGGGGGGGSGAGSNLYTLQVNDITTNGQFVNMPAGSIIVAASLTETTGRTVSVSLGSTFNGNDVLGSCTLSGGVPVAMLGTSLDNYSFSTDQPVYLFSGAWAGASVDMRIWYLSPNRAGMVSGQVYDLQILGATADGQSVNVPAGAIIIGVQLGETLGRDVTVSLGTTFNGTDVLAASVLASGNSYTRSMMGTSLDAYSFPSDQRVYLSSTDWNGSSVNMKVWYVL